jgi:hypothetical protein
MGVALLETDLDIDPAGADLGLHQRGLLNPRQDLLGTHPPGQHRIGQRDLIS